MSCKMYISTEEPGIYERVHLSQVLYLLKQTVELGTIFFKAYS